jgi:hypothetical protein
MDHIPAMEQNLRLERESLQSPLIQNVILKSRTFVASGTDVISCWRPVQSGIVQECHAVGTSIFMGRSEEALRELFTMPSC